VASPNENIVVVLRSGFLMALGIVSTPPSRNTVTVIGQRFRLGNSIGRIFWIPGKPGMIAPVILMI